MPLSVADIDRWSADAVREVFYAARAGAEISLTVSEQLGSLPVFRTWGGDAAEAAKSSVSLTQDALVIHGNAALTVARAANEAADGIKRVQDELARLRYDAGQLGFSIDPVTNSIVPGPNPKGTPIDAMGFVHRLGGILAEADAVDQDLADAINVADGDMPIPTSPDGTDAPVDPTGSTVLGDLQRGNDKGVLEAIERVKTAQAAYDAAAASAYVHGPGSPEADAAMAQLPQLKDELAHAINALGEIPDYSKIGPNSVMVGPDGQVFFGYLLNGQVMQVMGTLKNGTGEIFDQGTKAYYTYQNGKFVGARILDDGRAIATAEPLLTAVTTAVGAGPMFKAGQAGWAGLRTLFGAEALDAGADVTAGNVLSRGAELAAGRAGSAAHDLAIHGPGAWAPVTEAMSARAAAYQAQITGHQITEGYVVNGLKFDGFANGVLTDAKGYYAQFVSNGEFAPWFSGQHALLNQARNQLAVAGDTPVQWVFAEPEAAAAVTRLFQTNYVVGIDILVVPPA
jgi:hypothetical protein